MASIDHIRSGGLVVDVRRLTATLLAIPLFGLLACGNPEPADPVTSSPLPTASSSSPTPRPPKPETAEHFIRRWADVERRMENTGQTSEYLKVSGRCSACRDLARKVRSFYAADGYVHWAGWRILGIDHVGPVRAHVYEVRVDSAPTTYRETSTSPVKRLPGGPATHELVLKRRGLVWSVVHSIEVPQ